MERGDEESSAGQRAGEGPLCCVPESLVQCHEKEILDPEAAIKMSCTNLHCKSHRLLHRKCFENLERQLVRAAAKEPKARKWTQAQVKANVWKPRGQDVLHRMCPCHCGGALFKEQTGVPVPKSVAKKKPKPTLFDPSSSSSSSSTADHRLTKIPYPAMEADISKLMKLYFKSESRAPDFHEDEDESRQLFVHSIPKDSSKQDIVNCFQQFGGVVNIRISPPPALFGRVTFESPECVEKALASVPIMLFDDNGFCGFLKVMRVEPKSRTQGPTKVNSRSVGQEASHVAECSSHIPGAEASDETEIYWSDDEGGADEVDFEEDGWSKQDLILILLQVQAQFKQERQDWLEQKGDMEAGQLRLEEDNQAKFLELEEKITAQLVRQEEEYQARLEKIEEEKRAQLMRQEENLSRLLTLLEVVRDGYEKKEAENKVENRVRFEKMEAKNAAQLMSQEEKYKAQFEEMEARFQRLEEEKQVLKQMEEGRRQRAETEVADQLLSKNKESEAQLSKIEAEDRAQLMRQEEDTAVWLYRLFEKTEAENWRLDAENKDLKEELRVLKDQLVDINSRVGELEDTLEMEEEWEDVDSETETLVPEESEETAEQTEKVFPIKAIAFLLWSLLYILVASQK